MLINNMKYINNYTLTSFQLPVAKKVEQLENLTSDSNKLGSTEVAASVSILLTATEDTTGNLTV